MQSLPDILAKMQAETMGLQRQVQRLETLDRTGIRFNVMDYGATGNGVTDDTAAINAAFAAVTAWYKTVIFPPGTYLISDTLTCTNKTYLYIQGNQSVIQAAAGTVFTDKPMFNFAGSSHCRVENLKIYSALATNIPACALLLGRTATNSAGYNVFTGCHLYGAFEHATLYEVGDEVLTFYSCIIENTEASPAIFDSSTDHYSLGVESGVSNVRKQYYSCTISNFYTGTGGVCVEFHDTSQENAFRDCYFYGTEEHIIFNLLGTTSHFGLIIDNARVESDHMTSAASRFIAIAAATSLNRATIINIVYYITSDALIECMGDLNSSTIDLRFTAGSYPTHILVDNTAYLQGNILYYDKASAFNIAAGGYAVRNVIMGSNPTDANPFTGAGSYEGFNVNYNIVLAAGAYTATQPNKSQQGYFAEGDTTPTVLGFEFFRVLNANATSITTFDNGVSGQKIILQFETANTTLVHGSILLSGSINWNAPTNATITLIYDTTFGVWREISRTTP